MSSDDAAQPSLNLALSHYRAGRLDEADQAFRSLLLEQRGRDDASYGLGLVALRRGNLDEAHGWFSMVGAGGRKRADARYNMAAIEVRRGDREAAARHRREALELAPNHERALTLDVGIGPAGPIPRGASAETAGLRAAVPTKSSKADSDYYLPGTQEELDEYVRRYKERNRKQYVIDTWHIYPWWMKLYKISGWTLATIWAVVFFYLIINFVLPAIQEDIRLGRF